MRTRLFLALVTLAQGVLVALAVAPGCGSDVSIDQRPNDDGDGGSGGKDGGKDGKGGSTTSKGSGGKDALPDYVDPGCPDAGLPIYDFGCDPYNQNNGDCFAGESCYIFVEYPSEPCASEIYGSLCAPEGFGHQGDPCGGALDCAGGFVCVVTGAGNQCVELCNLTGEDGCPAGLVCETIDVEGFGGCL